MKKFFLIFLFVTSLLQAEWDQLFSDEEDPSLFHHVNVITGNLNLCFQDALVEGAKTLPIYRTYSSAGALEPSKLNEIFKNVRGGTAIQGGWNFLPHATLWIDLKVFGKDFKIYLAEPSGNLVAYHFSHHRGKNVLVFKPEKGVGQCFGSLGARKNISNQVLELNVKKGEATLFLPDGGSRIYVGRKFYDWDIAALRRSQKYAYGKSFYRLIREVLPSKHCIEYQYDGQDHLQFVTMMNPARTKNYASIRIETTHKKSPVAFNVHTSDGKFLHYKTMEHKKIDYISAVLGISRPQEETSYIAGRKGTGARIQQLYLGGKVQFHAYYYLPPDASHERKWEEKPDQKEFHTDKVSSLHAPLGPQGEMIPLAYFYYASGVTDVRDVDHRLIRYTHHEGRLLSVEYYNVQDQLVSVSKFFWEGERLKAKILCDEHSRPHFSKVFEYDAVGNVTQETLWGALTGEISVPFILNADGSLTGAERYSKRYTYLPGFNVPLTEEEDNGLTYTYHYLGQTDLLSAKFTCDGGKILTREFFIYDEDHLLIAEVIDDGSVADSADLQGATQRQIKRYQRDPTNGLVQTLNESYWDLSSQSDVFVKKVDYFYSAQKLVNREDVYDSQNTHRYTIYTDYDSQGRVIRKTTPLGQENTYTYDVLGNLLHCKEVGSLQKTLIYDSVGRLLATEEVDSQGLIKKTHTKYDAKGNLLEQTDHNGNTTRQNYDAFSRCIHTQFPLSHDQEGNSYHSNADFTYDVQGNLSYVTVAGGGTTYTRYNAFRKPVWIVQPDGTCLVHNYTPQGTLRKTLYPDGTRIDYLYDIFQRMISKKIQSIEGELLSSETWEYSAFQLLSYTDPNGCITRYTYDPLGRILSEQADSKILTYSYDSLGFLEKKTEAEVTHVQIHDVAGRVIEEWKEGTDGRIEDHMWFCYNAENQKTQATRLTSQGEAVDLFFYDRELRLTRHTDPQNNTTEILYTNEDGVAQKTITDPLGNQTVETQDPLNRLALRIQKDPDGKTVSQEELFYDKAGNLAKRISTAYNLHTPTHQNTVQWEYDLMGRVVKETEEGGKTTYIAYDNRGRVKRRTLPNATTVHYSYDGIDRLLEMKSSDATIHYTYHYTQGLDPTQIDDNILNTQLHRQYNTFGQLTQEINSFGLRTTWDYDAHGRCIAYTLPDNSSLLYTYLGGHLTDVSRCNSSNDILYNHHYRDFDLNGHVLQEDLILGSGHRSTTRDLLERPILQRTPVANLRTTYGPSGLVTTVENSLIDGKIYAYDALNQLIQEGHKHYSFDSLGNPTTCTVNAYNQIVEGPDYTIDYDLNGNPIQRIDPSGTTLYTYDALNRLTSITDPHQTTHYIYDPLSRLIAEQTSSSQIVFLYDGAEEIGAMTPTGTLLQLKVIGLGLNPSSGTPIAIEIDDQIYSPLTDFQGNIFALITPDKDIDAIYQIDAFGRESTLATHPNPWRFSSKRTLGNLVLFGHRFYDPSLGRWLTPDPSGYADGPNLYAYVLNSPLNRLDLFGLDSDARFPQEMMSMQVPMHKIITSMAIPVTPIIQCKGFLAEVPVDWILSCGHWHKLQFTPQERETGIVNIVDHFYELLPQQGSPIALITLQNGIRTTQKDLGDNVRATSNMVPEGTLTIGMYNPTEGLFNDCKRTLKERAGKDTSIVVLTRQFLVAISDSLHKINPNLLWLHIAHSEGGVISGNAIKGMTEEQKTNLKHQLYFLGLGPAKPLGLQYGRGVTNVYSRQDFITGWFALKYVNNPKYDVKFVGCKSKFSERTAYIADHAFLGGTYQFEQKVHYDDLKNLHGFYDGKTN